MKQKRPIALLFKIGLLVALAYISHNTIYFKPAQHGKNRHSFSHKQPK